MDIFLLVLIAFLALGLAYLIWMVRAGMKRQWRKLAILLAIPVILVSTLVVVSGNSAKREYAAYLKDIFDTTVVLPDPIYSYDSARSFNGDGYSIAVYELPQGIRERFAGADERFFHEFPQRSAYRGDWKTIHWRRAPFDERLHEYLKFALLIYDGDSVKGLSGQFDAIKKALERSTTFYAFYYHDPSGHIGDIDLFIVDLAAGKLYLINQST